MSNNPTDAALIDRALVVAGRQQPRPLQPATEAEYSRAGRRLRRARESAGGAWRGLEALPGGQGTFFAQRAAYVRLAHGTVVEALGWLEQDREKALATLRTWVPEAERYPPRPGNDPRGGVGEAGRARRGAHSKRAAAAAMPSGWLEDLWRMAVVRRYPHLDALAILILSGCRPAEICAGSASKATAKGNVMIALQGAKVTHTNGQPWRKLVVRPGSGPAQHLLALVGESPDGIARVRATCSPAVLSGGVAELVGDRWGRRVSAYDIRHARAADARAALPDLEACARWLGHSSESTQRYYARQPAGSGSLPGSEPRVAEAPRPVRQRSRRMQHEAAHTS